MSEWAALIGIVVGSTLISTVAVGGYIGIVAAVAVKVYRWLMEER